MSTFEVACYLILGGVILIAALYLILYLAYKRRSPKPATSDTWGELAESAQGALKGYLDSQNPTDEQKWKAEIARDTIELCEEHYENKRRWRAKSPLSGVRR